MKRYPIHSKQRVVLWSIALFLVAAGTASAQGIQGTLDQSYYQNRGAYYTYADAGDITIDVNVWGNATFPGFYRVREGTRLDDVLSMAGGAKEPALLTSRRRRATYVRLSRLISSTQRQIIFEQQFDDVTTVGEYPALAEGDVIYVETIETERFNWRDLATVTSLTLGVINVILQVQNLRN